MDKIEEELGELKAEIAARKSSKPADSVRVKEELGDLVFAVCNLARHLGVDAESAVELTTSRFSRRFRAVEQGAKESGRALRDMTLDEMDALWEEAKRKEG
jgi:ATP diphosphatase